MHYYSCSNVAPPRLIRFSFQSTVELGPDTVVTTNITPEGNQQETTTLFAQGPFRANRRYEFKLFVNTWNLDQGDIPVPALNFEAASFPLHIMAYLGTYSSYLDTFTDIFAETLDSIPFTTQADPMRPLEAIRIEYRGAANGLRIVRKYSPFNPRPFPEAAGYWSR